MPTYEIEAAFTFKGKFYIQAESDADAIRNMDENCGLNMGRVHSNLPESNVDWIFDMTPEKTVGKVKAV